MTLIERYIFRVAGAAFLATVGVLTAVIWLTQALHDLDLITSKGQSALKFLTITGMWIPSLFMVIAPIALFIAVMFSLNKLNGDSELVVTAASGLSPLGLLRPYLALIVAVAGLCALVSLWIMPSSFQVMRDAWTEVKSDFLTRIVRPGQFNTLESGLVFHYRDRGPGGELRGVFMLDRRDSNELSVYLAENGIIAKIDGKSYIVLQTGTIQKQDKGAVPAMVTFDSYALDLSNFGSKLYGGPLKPRERSTWDLLNYDVSDPYTRDNIGRFRADLHERFVSPLYALAMGLIAFAALGTPRTTRQTRGLAIGGATLIAVLLRVGGFGVAGALARGPDAVPFAYALPLLGMVGAGLYAFRSALVPLLRGGRFVPAEAR
ncbi:lipopolysaccharide export system permease protein [Rhodoblastus acidophilus]|uniref:Lipopolysaccharide export system permease protein n=1 Tax=Rhodoblastus acidophilus TaxID=1074 RepID=A0A212RG88_RHOAC|nr:LPS export ABC transporter permease LptF [Rhodoblastus acidophilus]PPQ39640.1 LPS export ABC transporter permease LptF [Rhodoblastus acidophilus]RAI24422.1 LPS export ABC transporter permease LptF [Rhodoblastus acidophilus]SNB71233.1 lipopolysaccharide export system permease protein [Rhodoblastus acidophilus]